MTCVDSPVFPYSAGAVALLQHWLFAACLTRPEAERDSLSTSECAQAHFVLAEQQGSSVRECKWNPMVSLPGLAASEGIQGAMCHLKLDCCPQMRTGFVRVAKQAPGRVMVWQVANPELKQKEYSGPMMQFGLSPVTNNVWSS